MYITIHMEVMTMKKSKRVISVLLSLLMLLSVMQSGLVVLAAEGGSPLTADQAEKIVDPGVIVTCSDVTRVSSGFGKNDTGSVIVPATESGVPASDVSSDDQISDYERNARAGEVAFYPTITIKFNSLPADIPQIKCVSGGTNVMLSSATYNKSTKTYSWTVVSGTAAVGSCLEFAISYSFEGRNYVNKCYSYVEGVAQPAGVFANTKAIYVKEEYFGIKKTKYYAGMSVATRLLGKGVYSSLDTYSTSSGTLRGYFDAGNNAFVSRSGSAYSTYGINTSDDTTSEGSPRVFAVNGPRSYADIYIDTSVVDSLDDINLRYATTLLGVNGGENGNVNLELVGVASGYVDASNSFSCNADSVLGTLADVGAIYPGGQRVTRFNGMNFDRNGQYTILAKFTTSHSGAVDNTIVPVTLRFHSVDKSSLRNLIQDITYGRSPESTKVSNINKGVNPQSWYFKGGFSQYETAMNNAMKIVNKPNATQDEVINAVNSLEGAYQNLVLAPADYTALDEAIEATSVYFDKEELYTEASVERLNKAISVYNATNNPEGVIEYGFNVIYQAQVDKWTQEILDAMEGMEYKPADYTEVYKAVEAANALEPNKTLYIDFSNVSAAVSAVRYDVKIVEQDVVDQFAADINAAIKALEFKTADYSQVNFWKDKAQSLVSSNYTPASYNQIRTAIRSIVPNLKITEQARVDGFAKNIQDAVEGLVEKPADYSGLVVAIDAANALVEEYYTPESYAKVKTALDATEGYENIGILSQIKVDRLKDALNVAMSELVMYDADYSAVLSAISRFEGMDTSQRTAISINAVSAAIGAVVYDLKVNEQARVDAFATDIENAIDNLDYEGADYTLVNNAIAQAESLDASYYADFSGVTNAINSVDWTLGVNRQDEVTQMATAITDAISQLLPGPADYSRVYTAIARFDALNKSLYTPNSVAAVEEIINSINWNYTKENQSVVTGYAADITDRILDLVEANADYSELNRIVNSIPSNLRVFYTSSSITALQTVLNSINWSLKAKDQATVTEYETAVSKAVSELVYLPGDYTDVDEAIAEGNAIILKNDPPISKESKAAFEKLVNSVNRNYNIVQLDEIAAIAAEIRAAYTAFTYDECIHNVKISLDCDRKVTFPGNVINVSVVLKTDFYTASSSIPVLYDSNYYTLVGKNVAEAYTFEGSYAEGSVQSGSITSPAKGYPSSYDAEAKAQWKYALITLSPSSNLSSDAVVLDPEQVIAKFQLKVNDDIDVSDGKVSSGRFFIDPAFLKTETYKAGKLFVGRYETSAVDLNVVTTGQTFDLTDADKTLTIVHPDSKAIMTDLEAAVALIPENDADCYVEETYTAFTEAVAEGQNVLDNRDSYTVAEQLDVDAVTDLIVKAYNALKLKDATTTPLDEALLLTPEYDYTKYTTETYSEYDSAVKAGQAILAREVLTILDDQEIADAADLINSTFESLTLKDFSYWDQLEAALTREVPCEESYYSVESYQAYIDAFTAADDFSLEDITILDDERGVDIIFKLNQAFDNLYLLDAEIKDLVDAVNFILPYEEKYYTPESYGDYTTALTAGQEILASEERLTILDNERISQAATDIFDMIDNLLFNDFSYWDLMGEVLEKYFDVDPEPYTEESYLAFLDTYYALDEYSFNDLYMINDEEGLEVINAVEDAYKSLVLKPADLKDYDIATAIVLPYEAENYVDELYTAFADAIDNAVNYNDHYITYLEQDKVDALVKAINDAFNALELKPFTYLDELEAAILNVPTYEEKYYDAELYSAYVTALGDVNEMITNSESYTILDEADAVTVIDAYVTALENLENGILPADYSEVDKAVEAASKLLPENYKNYSILEEALGSVVREKLILEQSVVDGYATAINDAIDKLVPCDGDYSAVTEAINNANAKLKEMNESGYALKEATVTALNEAIGAVDYTLTVFDVEAIAKFASDINTAADNLDFVPVIEIDEDSDAEFTDDGFVKGLKYLNSADDVKANFANIGKDTVIEVVETEAGFGTGTVVNFYDGEELIKTFVIVVEGDITGDSYVDALDVAAIADLVNNFEDPATDAQKLAVDLCEDGWLDTIDLAIIINMANEG